MIFINIEQKYVLNENPYIGKNIITPAGITPAKTESEITKITIKACANHKTKS